MSMIKRPTMTRNLIRVIKDNLATVKRAELHYKDEDKIESITPESFISDLEFIWKAYAVVQEL